ncbi:mitochondrial ribonuclease P protein 1 homolog [Mya arenaria]|uniref:mitochondrial ribonuclease P protein 1 homolog n=1 Tax=Mya arenaria TaxID=6604 RepID=UPI0022DFDC58|nr:mitochondrial ribonuclease P protein 1 homolog [Mya arenaria]
MYQAGLICRGIFSTNKTCLSKSLKTFLRRRQFCSSADVTSITGNTLNNAVDNHSNTADRTNSSSDSLNNSTDRLNSTAIDQNSAADSQISSRNSANERDNGNISDIDNDVIPLYQYKGNIRQYKLEKAKEFMDNLSPELMEKKVKIEAMIEGMTISNALVPDKIDLVDWQHLLGMNPNYNRILKYCKYLFLNEKSKESKTKKKIERREEMKEKDPMSLDFDQYCLPSFERTMFMRNWRRLRCLTSNIPVILDFNYPDVTIREKVQAVKQLQHVFHVNYEHPQPCHLHMTSVMDNDSLKQHLEVKGDTLCGTIHKKPFWEVFPKDNLVYLTPDGPELNNFTGDEIFIVGALVDIHDQSAMSYIKAKKLGIRCAALPMNNHLYLHTNATKRLPLNHVVQIMLDFMLHHDWPRAFKTLSSYKCVPKTEEGWRQKQKQLKHLRLSNRNFTREMK